MSEMPLARKDLSIEGCTAAVYESGTPAVNVREEVRLSASVSVMAPTCACEGTAPARGYGPVPPD